MNAQATLTYEQLRQFLVTAIPYAFNLSGLSEDVHPVARLEMVERENKAKALSGVKMAISDVLTILSREPAEKIERLSQALIAAKAPSLALVRAWSSRRVGAILTRGVIRSDAEFDQMKAFLDSSALEAEECERVQCIVDAYEFGTKA